MNALRKLENDVMRFQCQGSSRGLRAMRELRREAKGTAKRKAATATPSPSIPTYAEKPRQPKAEQKPGVFSRVKSVASRLLNRAKVA